MQIDAPDARKTAFCTPRQRCGIPCLCKNGSITSFSGFPSLTRGDGNAGYYLYIICLPWGISGEIRLSDCCSAGRKLHFAPGVAFGEKKRKRRATSHSEATLRFLFVIPHGSRPPKEHRNPGSYNQSGGGSWIRTSEVMDNRFTVCPLWPLGNSPISFADLMSIA